MAKISDWKIVATEGATIDGRAISRTWINEMADSYSLTEYTALIWPEHNRSNWSKYEGNNWGIVEQLKAEKRSGKLRLLAKITPNEHLLSANAKQQKLFTSIEPNPDYKGQGNCYLMGLAVTDSPASSGTTRLTFSKSNGEKVSHEHSRLEEIEFSECNASGPITNALSTLLHFFQSGGQLPEAESNPLSESNPQEEEPMNKEQFEKIEGTLSSIAQQQEKQQTQLNEFSTTLTQFSTQLTKQATPAEESTPVEESTPAEVNPAIEDKQFNMLLEQIKVVTDGQKTLQTQFNALKQEVPGQEGAGEGADNTLEAF